ncbi:hypothetical protein JK636_06350 [Clostridium sp. YIM B02515]|uniref:Lipoprotein n=1 Tax=Clostridium rhizosphaerae TaxID=2803861 RepID=A0ABS1T9M4_9CLOT|nr:hypothetical protein [Clostridium rhizosphaerae]MBL4935376.1 hypothetical protein [Clostridium rhizosphaerae]
MRKNTIALTTVLGICAAATTLMKLKAKNNSILENAVDENAEAEDERKDLESDKKQVKNKNKSQVKVSNSLITINIKLLSK